MRSPVFSADEQAKALDAVLEPAGIGGTGGEIPPARGRATGACSRLRDMIRDFRALVARHKGEVSARSPSPSRSSDRAVSPRSRRRSPTVTGKDVEVDVKVDPSIIGGLVVKVGSRMVDSSLRTKLNALKHAMKEVG